MSSISTLSQLWPAWTCWCRSEGRIKLDHWSPAFLNCSCESYWCHGSAELVIRSLVRNCVLVSGECPHTLCWECSWLTDFNPGIWGRSHFIIFYSRPPRRVQLDQTRRVCKDVSQEAAPGAISLDLATCRWSCAALFSFYLKGWTSSHSVENSPESPLTNSRTRCVYVLWTNQACCRCRDRVSGGSFLWVDIKPDAATLFVRVAKTKKMDSHWVPSYICAPFVRRWSPYTLPEDMGFCLFTATSEGVKLWTGI